MRSAVLVVAVLCLAGGDVAHAAGPVDTASSPIVLVVDSSGSMSEDDGTGKIKMDGAKAALLDFLTQVEPGTPIGLRTYPDQTAGGDCNNGAVRFAIAPRDPTTMSAVVRSLEPEGDTPTAEAMRAAADDLRASGYTHATMVILSDGESTCASPCDAARDIAQSGIDLQTITIGFRISPDGQKELQCIANATGGTYVDVDDGALLQQTLGQISRPTLRLTLTYPPDVTVAAGTGGAVRIDAKVENIANQQARGVTATMRFDAPGPALTRPTLVLGNLDPRGSRTVSWSFRPSVLSPSVLRFSVVARAGNALSDVMARGTIRVHPQSRAGPLLAGRHQLAILGDSYSSGEGTDHYLYGTDTAANHCHRSTETYLMKAFHQPASSVIACSGAVVNDLHYADADNHIDSQLAQLSALDRSRGVDAVVLTLGGNDAEFSSLAKHCFVPRSPCSNRGDAFLDQELTPELRESLAVAYGAINGVVNGKDARARHGSPVPILVLAYVLPVPVVQRGCLAVGNQLTADELSYVVRFATRLNGIVEAATIDARRRGVPAFFVPMTEQAFQPDHTVCDRDSYARATLSVNGAGLDLWHTLILPWGKFKSLESVVGRALRELMHPNADGYEAISSAIINWTLSDEARADAEFLRGNIPYTPPPKIEFSNEELGQLGPHTPTLQGGTSYPLSVGGFAPDSDVEIDVRSNPVAIATAKTDATGAVKMRVGLPPTIDDGTHKLVVLGIPRQGTGTRVVEIPFRIGHADDVTAIRIAGYGTLASALIAAAAFAALALRARRASA